MKKDVLLISTIAQDAAKTARSYGLGLELAEYCTASNLDENFSQTDTMIFQSTANIPLRVLHGPFNELFPCAIDPKARELARIRYRQAISAAQHYGISKVVLHAGFHPYLYYPCWFSEQSIQFWQEFVREIPEGMCICLENVLEKEPKQMLELVEAVHSPKIRLCLDVGHIHAYSSVSALQWIETCAKQTAHFHIHNNDGSCDAHGALNRGGMDMKELLRTASALCPNATFTLELLEAESSVRWMMENGLAE